MIKLDQVINLRLMSHPLNWAIVMVTLLFGAIAWHLILSQMTPQGAEVSPVAS